MVDLEEIDVWQNTEGDRFFKDKDGKFIPLKYGARAFKVAYMKCSHCGTALTEYKRIKEGEQVTLDKISACPNCEGKFMQATVEDFSEKAKDIVLKLYSSDRKLD